MKRSLLLSIAIAGAGLLVSSCADQFTETEDAHPANWVETHTVEQAAQQQDCGPCHGVDLAGGTVGVSCSECHLDGPPFSTHVPNWNLPIVQHQTFALRYPWTGCAVEVCHATDLRGGLTGPSCFESFGCHAEGPPAPHLLPYSSPEAHGLAAKSNLLYCRNCHGTPPNHFDGGFVTDPQILAGAASCSVCHPDARAHPTFWQGTDDPNSAYLATHQNVIQLGVDIAATCGLCHNTAGVGDGPRPGAPSCFDPSFVNAGGTQMPCHADGP